MKILSVNDEVIEGIEKLILTDHILLGKIFVIHFLSGGISFIPVNDIISITA